MYHELRKRGTSARGLKGICWRLVEAQHYVSTAKLTDSANDQLLLERLIEATKSSVPPECEHLNYLLSTPFRYGSPYPHGSRFCKAGLTEGVFYAAESADTAAAEITFHRLLFFAESPATPWPGNPGEYTAFAAEFAAARTIDLTRPPLNADRALWTHPTDYVACQALAAAARSAAIDVVRYQSVRDPSHRASVALLTCRVFTKPNVVSRQTWRIHLDTAGARAFCEAPKHTLAFGRDTFATDPRIAGMTWIR
ncbi:MAG: RES domain-containing protein [Rhizobiales bacterium]|nr:RES domain-containing protein [Hyphomicrobiales bacterium]